HNQITIIQRRRTRAFWKTEITISTGNERRVFGVTGRRHSGTHAVRPYTVNPSIWLSVAPQISNVGLSFARSPSRPGRSGRHRNTPGKCPRGVIPRIVSGGKAVW